MAHAIVCIVDQEWGTQVEAARAFGCTTRTVRRLLRRFEEGGLRVLGRRGGYPAGRPRRPAGRSRLVLRLKSEGRSNCEVAARMGISEKAVRNALRRLGWKPQASAQLYLALDGTPEPSSGAPPGAADAPPTSDPNLSAFDEEPIPFSLDRDPADRCIDRLLACIGLLDDAAPLFRSGERVPRAGVLLAVPAILDTGVLACAREIYGSLGPAFYGLRTSIVAFLVMALPRRCRVRPVQGLPCYAAPDLERLHARRMRRPVAAQSRR